MAEVVNRNTEQILPQFEEMIKVKLFSPSEMRNIIQSHVSYEYKIVKREKQVCDFQQYVAYKTDLLKLVRIRMKAKSVEKKDRRKIENVLIKHIIKLYNMMVKYFSTDESVWLDFIDFMIKEKKYAKVVVLYDSVLSLHMSNAELFSRAANFMIKYLKDINLARKMLFKGIRIHKRSQSLYLDFFRIELEYAAKKRKQCDKNSEKLTKDPVLCGKTAEVICLSALKAIDKLKFKLSLLDVCSKYKFMKKLQKKLYRMLKSQHCFDADMWKHIAKLQKDGESVAPVNEMDAAFEKVMKISPAHPALKSSYMDWIISRNDLSLVRDVFSNMSRIPPYDVNLFKKMIDVEMSQQQIDVKRIRELFTMACLYFGSSHEDIWLDYLRFEKLQGDPLNVTNIYWQAVKQLEPALSDKFIAEYSISKAD